MKMLALALLILAVAAVGCRRHVVVRETRDGDVMVIERGHIHTDHCGHFFHRGHWRHHPGHVHRHECGHHLRGGVWVVMD